MNKTRIAMILRKYKMPTPSALFFIQQDDVLAYHFGHVAFHALLVFKRAGTVLSFQVKGASLAQVFLCKLSQVSPK